MAARHEKCRCKGSCYSQLYEKRGLDHVLLLSLVSLRVNGTLVNCSNQPNLHLLNQAISLLHLHQQSARSRRLEHPSEENDRKDEIDHIQSETYSEVRGRKSASFDNLAHTFE